MSGEKSTEQILAEVQACLTEIEEIRLPSLEVKVRDIRELCKGAYGSLTLLDHRLHIQKRKD